MALTVGTNSYISRADANTYFADRLNSSMWTSATDPNKDGALIQATQIINSKNFLGTKTSSSQVMKFPRIGLYEDGYSIDYLTVPQRVIDATCELAIWLLVEDYTEPDGLLGFDEVQIGPIQVKTKTTTSKALPPMASALLSPFMTNSTRLVRG